MPRYFFRLSECGTVLEDREGAELPDTTAALHRATIEARSIMAAEVASGKLCLSCRIEICDNDGEQVAVVPFRDVLSISGL